MIVKRESDGKIFRQTIPDSYSRMCLLNGPYFRGVDWKPRRWWQSRGRWVDNGEVWEPPRDTQFNIIEEDQ